LSTKTTKGGRNEEGTTGQRTRQGGCGAPGEAEAAVAGDRSAGHRAHAEEDQGMHLSPHAPGSSAERSSGDRARCAQGSVTKKIGDTLPLTGEK